MTRLLLCLAILLSPSSASADWVHWSSGSGPYLVDVSSPDGDHVFTGGFTMELVGGYVPELTNYVYASSDGGRTFADVTGNLTSELLEGVRGLFFVNSQLGFVIIGSELHKTIIGGNTWVASDIDCAPQRIHFHDALHGTLTCPGGQLRLTSDGGQSWSAIETGVSTDLNRMFWLDNQHGWISTYDETEDGDGHINYTDGVVLRTSDGGATWAPSNTIDERGLGKLFFLADGQTGWLTAWKWINEERREAHLYRTTDGGETFTDMNLPIQVGTIQSMISGPLNTYGINAMYWADENHGHLGGTAFIIKTNNSQTGEQQYWRNVDYITHDGGASWARTDHGTIEIDIMGQTPIDSDGAIMAGHMTGLYTGWMVGEAAAVWGYEYTCTDNEECGANSVCDSGACVPSPSETNPENGGGAPLSGEDDFTATGRAKQFNEGGCNAGRTRVATLALVLALLWIRLRRRQSSCHSLGG